MIWIECKKAKCERCIIHKISYVEKEEFPDGILMSIRACARDDRPSAGACKCKIIFEYSIDTTQQLELDIVLNGGISAPADDLSALTPGGVSVAPQQLGDTQIMGQKTSTLYLAPTSWNKSFQFQGVLVYDLIGLRVKDSI